MFDFCRATLIAINTAPADGMAHVLHLEMSAAGAIVQHRTKHGSLRDFESLAVVPGLDVAQLRTRRDAIVF